MKKLVMLLTTISMSVTTFASPIATFDFLGQEVITAKVTESKEESLHEDVKAELAFMCKAREEGITISSSVMPILYNPNLSISQAEFERLYTLRMSEHKTGENPLPVRYLPVDYDNNFTIADSQGLDRTIMYEVILGYPIFYRIERYIRPSNTPELLNLPTLNSDKLPTLTEAYSSKIGTLYLS